jgi:pyruvate kinase
VEAVTMMAKTVKNVENSHYDDLTADNLFHDEINVTESVAESSVVLSQDIDAKVMIVLSMTGSTARFVSKYRPELPIIVTTSSSRVSRQLSLSWGVSAIHTKRDATDEQLINNAMEYAKKQGYLKKGENAVLIKGHPVAAKRQQASSIEIISL